MSRWSGQLVADELGVQVRDAPTNRIPLKKLVGLALRRNPKRAHLLVSTVLGKHVPTNPQTVLGAGRLLGLLTAAKLASDAILHDDWLEPQNGDALLEALARDLIASIEHSNLSVHLRHQLNALAHPVAAIVLGYAETATALGAAVAQQLGAPYIHSTRYPEPQASFYGAFEEAHSHATAHHLTPGSDLLDRPLPLVLVDDELTTGATALNTIRELHAKAHHPRYVLATLVDLRSAEDKARMAATAADLGVQVDVVALASGTVTLPPELAARADEYIERTAELSPAPPNTQATVEHLLFELPPPLKEGVESTAAHQQVAAALARRLPAFDPAERVLVLGIEEDMYLPLLVANELHHGPVTFSTTTRSPVHPVAASGYAIRAALRYEVTAAREDTPERFAYNLPALETVIITLTGPEQYSELAAPGGLLAQLRAQASRIVLLHGVAALPAPLTSPNFGSYAQSDVRWLLKDLSAVELEAPTEEREEAIQAGGAHYSESLPIEYQPSAEYQQLFRTSLAESAPRLAAAVATVGELILAARPKPVLVSLARAGVPVGVLLRRYLQEVRAVEAPHYAVSIVRGRGLDVNALNYLAVHHDPAQVIFVDGWTGKGAIVRELRVALEEYAATAGVQFAPELAVLADPGRCVTLYGTREDYLIPSACLNSTVSGLVSRTVLREDLIGPRDYHGAKFYSGLAAADVSEFFVAQVAAHFGAVAAAARAAAGARVAAPPDFAGWAAVEEISAAYGINNVNLVKPGVGETTRVLLRRVPWRILMRPDRFAELAHVRLLAEQRGVELELVENLPYSCVGLIHPQYTRGATGFDGGAA